LSGNVVQEIAKLVGRSIAGITLPSNTVQKATMLCWPGAESIGQPITGTVLPGNAAQKIVKLIGKSIAEIALPNNTAREATTFYWPAAESVG
jgi:hypothetical protein